jgi:acetylornithine/N-succinyldiaminopimelate aminotransferase
MKNRPAKRMSKNRTITSKRTHQKAKRDNAFFQREHLLSMEPNYGIPSLTFLSGKGAYLKDSDGKEYLDFLAGIATNALGQAHPAIVDAISSQVKKLGHISNFYSNPQPLRLARRLQQALGDNEAKVFFCNSGAEANEAAIKLSRLSGRNGIIATEGAFHGRTMGALSITGQEAKQKPFKPLLKGVKFVPFGDSKAIARAINRKTAMVIVEPIQGENGVIVPPDGYLLEIAEITRKNGVLFAIDSVQTGIGRCGTWFGFDSELIQPDIVTLAKGIGGGLPLGAVLIRGAAKHFSAGEHGSTFGGNPIACAAANAVFDVIEEEKLMAKALSHFEILKRKIMASEEISEVRGRGLLIGIVLARLDAFEVVRELVAAGVLANATSSRVVRIAPPLIIGKKEVDLFVKRFREVISLLTEKRDM